MSDTWAEYVEALGVMARAPAAARARRERIDAAAARTMRAADEDLRPVVARRAELERRAREVESLLQALLTEQRVPAEGPSLPPRIPVPATMREALDTIDRVERQVRDDTERLETARRLADLPEPTRRRWPYLLAGTAALALLAIILVIVVY
jgi:hypothetical protein